MLKESAYWATAAFGFIWPMLFVLAGVYFYQQYCKNIETQREPMLRLMGLSLCSFLAAFSQEQISVVVVAIAILSLIIHIRKAGRKYIVVDSFVTCFSLGGLLLLLLAPGNMVRMMKTSVDFYQLSLVEKLTSRIPKIFLYNIRYLWIYVIILFVLLIFVSLQLVKEKKGIKVLNWIGFGVSILGSCGMMAFRILNPNNTDISRFFLNSGNALLSAILGAVILMTLVYILSIYFISRQRTQLWLLFLCSTLSQAMLVLVPNDEQRLQLILLYFLILVIGILVIDWLVKIPKNYLKLTVLAIIILLSLGNFLPIFFGYARNSSTHARNDRVLQKAAYAINTQREDIKEIKLEMLPDLTYSAVMPYEPQFTYIRWWIREYYNIPWTVELVWVENQKKPD